MLVDFLACLRVRLVLIFAQGLVPQLSKLGVDFHQQLLQQLSLSWDVDRLVTSDSREIAPLFALVSAALSGSAQKQVHSTPHGPNIVSVSMLSPPSEIGQMGNALIGLSEITNQGGDNNRDINQVQNLKRPPRFLWR